MSEMNRDFRKNEERQKEENKRPKERKSQYFREVQRIKVKDMKALEFHFFNKAFFCGCSWPKPVTGNRFNSPKKS